MCGDATYNRGDRINLMSQIDLLRANFQNCKIYFDSYRPEIDEKWYTAIPVKRHYFPSKTQIKLMKQADVIIWGGGALLTDNASRTKIPYSAFLITYIKWRTKKPIMAWAQGMVINTKLGKFFAKIPLRLVDKITVRDYGSYQAVKKVDPKLEVVLTADPAVLAQQKPNQNYLDIFNAEKIPTNSRPLIAIATTFCSFHYNPNVIIPWKLARKMGIKPKYNTRKLDQIICNLAQIADKIVENLNADILLLPTYPAPWENDLPYFEKIQNLAKNKKNIHLLRQDVYSPALYISMWKRFSAVISIPMHHCIISVLNNTPCVNIYYEEKGKQFFERLKATDRLISIEKILKDNNCQIIIDKLKYTLDNWKGLSKATSKEFSIIKEAARKNITILKNIIK